MFMTTAISDIIGLSLLILALILTLLTRYFLKKGGSVDQIDALTEVLSIMNSFLKDPEVDTQDVEEEGSSINELLRIFVETKKDGVNITDDDYYRNISTKLVSMLIKLSRKNVNTTVLDKLINSIKPGGLVNKIQMLLKQSDVISGKYSGVYTEITDLLKILNKEGKEDE